MFRTLLLLALSSLGASLTATTAVVCKIYDVNKPVFTYNEKMEIKATFTWYGCTGKAIGRYIDLKDPLATRDSVFRYALQKAEVVLRQTELERGEELKFDCAETIENNGKMTAIIFRVVLRSPGVAGP